MFASSAAQESKAISLPSGDQRDVPVNLMPNELSCIAFEPSELETQTSWLPDRSDWKVILVPSGEYSGPVCSRDEVTTFSAGACGWERSRRQIFVFVWTCS